LTDNNLKRGFDVMTSGAATMLRLGMGINSQPAATKPKKLLELYDIEACPYCRIVREALTELDLDAVIYPCPKGGKRFRPKVVEMGSKAQFPFLVDPNSGRQMYESLDIIAYLFDRYGGRALPLKWRPGSLQKFGAGVAMLSRPWQGLHARPSRRPSKRLELYSFESSPYARLVRERLCEREIHYLLRNTGRAALRDWLPPPLRAALNIEPSSQLHNRARLLKQTQQVSIPYLVDPNTGAAMFQSAAIVDYLDKTYAKEVADV
jgi:glutathione S-transferase